MTRWVLLQERAENWPLNPLYGVVECYGERVSKTIGVGYGEVLTRFFSNGAYEFYLPKKGIDEVSRHCFNLLKNDLQLPSRLKKTFLAKIIPFLSFCEKINKTNSSMLTNRELASLYQEYYDKYFDAYFYSEPFAFAVKDALAEELEKELKKKTGSSKEFGIAFALLNTPLEKPFAVKEEEHLLKTYLEIVKKNDLGSPFAKGLIARHAEEYGWIPFDYAGNVWNEEYFLNALKALQASRFNASKRLAEIEEYYSTLEEKQKQLQERLGLSDFYVALFEAARTCSFLMDFKKECFTQAHLLTKCLIVESAGRLSLSLKQAYAATPHEVIKWLEGDSMPNLVELEARGEFCVVYTKGLSSEIFSGENAKNFLKSQNVSLIKTSDFAELKGVCACAGTVTGRVKVVRKACELSKLAQGDVLVTCQTTPDFVHGMKRAAAIVTDEGGITCHAAIVSREFGIPCVVGTRDATRVFHDGDLVEVKASHGTVKVIEGAKRNE